MSLNTILSIAETVGIDDQRFVGQTLSRNMRIKTSEILTVVPFKFTMKPHNYLLYSQNRAVLNTLRVADRSNEQYLNFSSTGWTNYIAYQGSMLSTQISTSQWQTSSANKNLVLGNLPATFSLFATTVELYANDPYKLWYPTIMGNQVPANKFYTGQSVFSYTSPFIQSGTTVVDYHDDGEGNWAVIIDKPHTYTGEFQEVITAIFNGSENMVVVKQGDFCQVGRYTYIATADVPRGIGSTVTIPVHRNLLTPLISALSAVIGQYGTTIALGGYSYTGVTFPVILQEYPTYTLVPMTNDSFISWNGNFSAIESVL